MTLAPLTCAEAFKRLDDYLDRELSPEETVRVAKHLEVCARCAGEIGIERQVLEDIRMKLGRIKAPRGLMARISAQLKGG